MFNHYNDVENLGDTLFWFDYLRTIKDVPFWNTETQTSWNGSTDIGQIMKPEGFCRINSWLPFQILPLYAEPRGRCGKAYPTGKAMRRAKAHDLPSADGTASTYSRFRQMLRAAMN